MNKLNMKTMGELRELFGKELEKFLFPYEVRKLLQKIYREGKTLASDYASYSDSSKVFRYGFTTETNGKERMLHLHIRLGQAVLPDEAWHITFGENYPLNADTVIRPMGFVTTELYIELLNLLWKNHVDWIEPRTFLRRIQEEVCTTEKKRSKFLELMEDLSIGNGQRLLHVGFSDDGAFSAEVHRKNGGETSTIHDMDTCCPRLFGSEKMATLFYMPEAYIEYTRTMYEDDRTRYQTLVPFNKQISLLLQGAENGLRYDKLEDTGAFKGKSSPKMTRWVLKCKKNESRPKVIFEMVEEKNGIKILRCEKDGVPTTVEDPTKHPLLIGAVDYMYRRVEDNEAAQMKPEEFRVHKAVTNAISLIEEAAYMRDADIPRTAALMHTRLTMEREIALAKRILMEMEKRNQSIKERWNESRVNKELVLNRVFEALEEKGREDFIHWLQPTVDVTVSKSASRVTIFQPNSSIGFRFVREGDEEDILIVEKTGRALFSLMEEPVFAISLDYVWVKQMFSKDENELTDFIQLIHSKSLESMYEKYKECIHETRTQEIDEDTSFVPIEEHPVTKEEILELAQNLEQAKRSAVHIPIGEL